MQAAGNTSNNNSACRTLKENFDTLNNLKQDDNLDEQELNFYNAESLKLNDNSLMCTTAKGYVSEIDKNDLSAKKDLGLDDVISNESIKESDLTQIGNNIENCESPEADFSETKNHNVEELSEVDKSGKDYVCDALEKNATKSACLSQKNEASAKGNDAYSVDIELSPSTSLVNQSTSVKDHTLESDVQQKESTFARKEVFEYNINSEEGTQKNRLQLLYVSEDRPHVCNICLKTFARKGHLQRHILTHTKERSFLCNICQKTFAQKCHLQQHYLTHTKEKPHSCDICNKAFNHKSSLNKHYLRHITPKNFICDVCEKAFATESDLERHCSKHTKGELYVYRLKLMDGVHGSLLSPMTSAFERGTTADVLHKNVGSLNKKTGSTSLQKNSQEQKTNKLSVSKTNLQQNFDISTDEAKDEEDAFLSKNGVKNMDEECIYDVNSLVTSKERNFQGQHASVKDYVYDSLKEDPALNGAGLTTDTSTDVNSSASTQQVIRETRDLLPSKERPHVCHICNKAFKLKNTLHGHYLTHTKDKPHICDVCNRAFAHRSNLMKHCLIHTKERPYVCDVCHKGFSQKGSLTGHYLVHTKEKPYICNVCERSFTQRSNLYKHQATHASEKPHVCEYCNKAFFKKCSLQAHLLTHTEEKNYVCEICGKAFALKTYLIKHYVRHELENPHVCSDTCGISCPHWRRKNRVKEKKHVCEICSRAFSKRYHLERHYPIHTRQKEHVCDICDRAFSQIGNFRTHYLSHTRVKSHVCSVCKKAFSQKSNLQQHMKVHKAKKSVKHISLEDNLTEQPNQGNTENRTEVLDVSSKVNHLIQQTKASSENRSVEDDAFSNDDSS